MSSFTPLSQPTIPTDVIQTLTLRAYFACFTHVLYTDFRTSYRLPEGFAQLYAFFLATTTHLFSSHSVFSVNVPDSIDQETVGGSVTSQSLVFLYLHGQTEPIADSYAIAKIARRILTLGLTRFNTSIKRSLQRTRCLKE